jgi:hypothetical protein
MPNSPVTPNIHQTFDVHLNFGAQRSFDFILGGNYGPYSVRFIIGQSMHPFIRIDTRFLTDMQCTRATDAKNIGKGDLNMLVFREVNSGDSSQVPGSLN